MVALRDWLHLDTVLLLYLLAVVVATGGKSIPKIGATDFGYRIARQFGLRLRATRPGLVPLTLRGSLATPINP